MALRRGAPPRVTFSRHTQVAPRASHGAGIDQDQRDPDYGPTQRAARGSGRAVNAGNGPIASVSRENARSYLHKETPGGEGRPGDRTDREGERGSTGGILHAGQGGQYSGDSTTRSGDHPGAAAAGGGGGQPWSNKADNKVYDFSQRVFLTSTSHLLHVQAQHKARPVTPNTAYIYETILGSPSSRLRRARSDDVTMYVNSVITNDLTSSDVMTKSVSGSVKSLKSSKSSRPPGADSPGAGAAYRNRKPATTRVVDVGPAASLPPTMTSRGVRRGRGGSVRGPRGGEGFFPPVKRREAGYMDKKRRGDMRTPPFLLELAPEEEALWGMDRAPSAKSSVARTDPASSCHSRQYALSFTPPVYPHVSHDVACDDITSMPRPRMMVSRGELPWVFRQKVKRNMNELSKIMASRPPQSMDASGTFSYRYDL